MVKKYLLLMLYCSSASSISEEKLNEIKKSVSELESRAKALFETTDQDQEIAERFQDPTLLFDADACYQNALSKLSKEEYIPKPQLVSKTTSLELCTVLSGLGAFFGIGYAYLRYTLYKAERYLAHPQLLSSFRNDLSVDSLFSIPKEVITQWILEEIQERYHDTNPVKTFYKEVQKEEQKLQEYLATYLNLRDLSWFFDVSAIEDIPDRLKVLEHLKNLVLIWEIESSIAAAQAEPQAAGS